jgi:hypothetical protein
MFKKSISLKTLKYVFYFIGDRLGAAERQITEYYLDSCIDFIIGGGYKHFVHKTGNCVNQREKMIEIY